MYTLFPHQKHGAEFLSESEGTKGLFFGMGTGKTLTALEAAKRVDATCVLVIAPPIALPMWQSEAGSYLNKIATILKTGKTPIVGDVLVVSYAIAAKRSEELRDWLDGGILICDESHALKNAKAKRTKAILGRGGIAAGASHSWMLTGTPITRWNDDLYPFLCRADLQGLKRRCGGAALDRFARRYTVQQQKQYSARMRPAWVTVANRNTQELADWTYGDGFALRVDLDEVHKNMPPLTTNAYNIPLDSDAELRSMLKEVEGKSLEEIKEMGQKSPELATIRRRLGVAKVPAAVAEIAERIESGQNVLVGAWHTEVIDALAEGLKKYGHVGVIDGRASSQHKQALQDSWNAGKTVALICQIGAAGVSLNLQQGGSQIVVVEEDWSPTIMDQFYARLWRYGQEKHVHVDILRSDTKLDKALAKIASAKAAQAEKHNAIGREYTSQSQEEKIND